MDLISIEGPWVWTSAQLAVDSSWIMTFDEDVRCFAFGCFGK